MTVDRRRLDGVALPPIAPHSSPEPDLSADETKHVFAKVTDWLDANIGGMYRSYVKPEMVLSLSRVAVAAVDEVRAESRSGDEKRQASGSTDDLRSALTKIADSAENYDGDPAVALRSIGETARAAVRTNDAPAKPSPGPKGAGGDASENGSEQK